jgi:thymidylate synthase (FAD)
LKLLIYDVNLVKPSVEIVCTWGSEDLIAALTDVLYHGCSIKDALSRVDDKLVERRILNFLKRGHWSVFEFAGVSFLVVCSRVCSHQLVRHRVASYWQESQRRVKISGYIIPKGLDHRFIEYVHKNYLQLIDEGVKIEDARYLSVNASATRIWVQMNLREVAFNFLPLRECIKAQAEIRYIAYELHRQLTNIFPTIMKHTGPRCIVEGYCREGVVNTEECRGRARSEAYSLFD